MARVPEAAELADDISEIKSQLAALLVKLEHSYVPRELYDARHTALRNEIALEFAALKRDMEQGIGGASGTANAARTLAMWCLGTVATAVIVALVGFVATGGAT